MTTCTVCGQPLTGGLDTFGEVDQPMCWTCWSELNFPEDLYIATLHDLEAAKLQQLWEELDKQHGFIV